MVAETPRGHSVGSALLIGPWHALTAAHVIYPLREPYRTLAISVSPGSSPSSEVVHEANGWAVSPGWNPQDCKTNGLDWGLIRFAKPVASATGFWRMSSFVPNSLPNSNCRVAGYPVRPGDKEATQMFQSSGILQGSPSITVCNRTVRRDEIIETAQGTQVQVTATSQLIVHDAASEFSMSGGPVWLEGSAPLLVAIHAGNLSNGRLKKAVLLNPGVRTAITDLMNGSLRPLPR